MLLNVLAIFPSFPKGPATMVSNGLAVVPRYPINTEWEELARFGESWQSVPNMVTRKARVSLDQYCPLHGSSVLR